MLQICFVCDGSGAGEETVDEAFYQALAPNPSMLSSRDSRGRGERAVAVGELSDRKVCKRRVAYAYESPVVAIGAGSAGTQVSTRRENTYVFRKRRLSSSRELRVAS